MFSVKSRVLLSVREEEESYTHSYYTPSRSFCIKDYITQWFHDTPRPDLPQPQEPASIELPIPKVDVLDVELENNQTGEGRSKAAKDNRKLEEQASMHPDITVMAQTKQMDTTA